MEVGCALLFAGYARLGVGASVWPILAVVFGLGLARGFSDPALPAFEAQVVPRELLLRASAWQASVWQAAAIAGPALGGVLYAALGARGAYLFAAALFGVALGCVAWIRPKPRPQFVPGEPVWQSIKEGLAFVLRRQVLVGSMALDLLPEMEALNVLGPVAERTGAYVEAGQRFGEALVLARRLGLEAVQGDLLTNLALVEAAQGRPEVAGRHVEDALALHRHLDHRLGIVVALELRGALALDAGRLEEVREALGQGLALARDLGFHQRLPLLLRHLAQVAFEEGDFGEARRRGGEALAAARADNHLTLEIAALNILGRACGRLGQDREARGHLAQSLRLAGSIQETPQLLEALAYLAELWAGRGRPGEAARPRPAVWTEGPAFPRGTRRRRTAGRPRADGGAGERGPRRPRPRGALYLSLTMRPCT